MVNSCGQGRGEEKPMTLRGGTHGNLQMDSEHYICWKTYVEINVANVQIWQSLVSKIDINLYTFFCTVEIFHNLKNVFTCIGRVIKQLYRDL